MIVAISGYCGLKSKRVCLCIRYTYYQRQSLVVDTLVELKEEDELVARAINTKKTIIDLSRILLNIFLPMKHYTL